MKLRYDNEAVSRFCHERGVARLEIFGSALRDDFRSDSDVDLLCTLTTEKDQHCGLLEWVDMQFKLEKIFGRPVDLVSRWAIERSRNPYRRHAILSTARPILSKDNAYLADILDSARIIRQHLAGMNREQFLADQRTQDAVVRRFEIIGEAARHLSPAALKALPDVPWNLMVGMRNLLIHDYDDVDPKRVWTDSQNDLPPLIARLEKYLAAEK